MTPDVWQRVGEEREEWVLSGGFDRRLVVWKVGGVDEDRAREEEAS